MTILLMLSEEVLDFSKGEMIQSKIQQLKTSLNNEFFLIYQLCEFVLTNSTKPKLIKTTLETLLRYLSWIPFGYIFETPLVQALITKFLPEVEFRVLTVKCLAEIAQLQPGENQYSTQFAQIFCMVMEQLYKLLPSTDIDVGHAFENGSEEEQNFIQDLASFLGIFLTFHKKDVEKDEFAKLVIDAHLYMVQISMVEELEVFKICLEYWASFTEELYHDASRGMQNQGILNLNSNQSGRRQMYANVLSKLRHVIIARMAKPEEVIVVEDENGNIVRDVRKDGEQVTRYKQMKSILVFLTHLDTADTIQIMSNGLNVQVSQGKLSWTVLNTLCWAIGSIADVQNENDEKKFLVYVIKELLSCCENTRGKDAKAVVASNIMYIVGQYPRFLHSHWKFLTTVIQKLFEFMHETHPGVQDMACDTFLKIVKKCKPKFSEIQEQDTEPFTISVIKQIGVIISDLSDQQTQTFYEGLGFMVSAHKAEDQELVISKLMELPNSCWLEIINQAKINPDYLKENAVIKKLANILKTNVKVCLSVGPGFITQISSLYLDLLNVCKFYSSQISSAIQQHGDVATKHSHVKEMRTVKRETLNLINSFIQVCHSVEVVHGFLPPLLPNVLEDYKVSVPDARDNEVLSLVATIVAKCQSTITNEIPVMFNAVFECTLQMITTNYQDHPEIRYEFYNFLKEVTRYCFPALKAMGGESFKVVVHSIIWAFKHTMRNISELGLEVTLLLLEQINNDTTEVSNSFYQTYFLHLLQDLFFILTDTFHKSGFKKQALILTQLFSMVESGRVTAALGPDASVDNRIFMREYVMQLLLKSFPNLSPPDVHAFVVGLFEKKDFDSFCNHLRDFLVQLKEFSDGDPNKDLFSAEDEANRSATGQRELAIPGLVGANDPRRETENM
jgi:exportin-1